MATDLADYSQAVQVLGGTVSITGPVTATISGTVTVSISGTPTVNIGTAPTITVTGSVSISSGTVSISGTVPVTISSGTVTINNASIAVINATGTKITSARPPKELFFQVDSNGTFTYGPTALDPDVQALVLQLIIPPLSNYSHVRLYWDDAGGAPAWVLLDLYVVTQAIYVIPIHQFGRYNNSFNPSAGVKLTVTSNGNVKVWLSLVELFESAPEWLTLFPQPKTIPNQPADMVPVVNPIAYTAVIAPVANVKITLFRLPAVEVVAGGVALPAGSIIKFGHGPNAGAVTEIAEFSTGLNAVPAGQVVSVGPLDLTPGITFPAGDGLFVFWTGAAAAGGVNVTPVYSLS